MAHGSILTAPTFRATTKKLEEITSTTAKLLRTASMEAHVHTRQGRRDGHLAQNDLIRAHVQSLGHIPDVRIQGFQA